MTDNKKYYYLKLKESFFDSDELKVLEAMPDGYKYSNILLKLNLKSLKYEGKLMLNEHIPYNASMLATITNHSVGDVERALKVFESLSLIEVLDNGSIYMLDIQTLIGKSSSEGDRKKAYRMKIEAEKTGVKAIGQMSGQTSDIHPPELEIELEKETELEIDVVREPEKKENNNDNPFSLIYKFWEDNGFGIMQPITIQKMQHWLADFNNNHEMILKALEVTVEQGADKCNFGYVNRILQNWTNRKFETVEQVEAAEQQRNQTKQSNNTQNNKPDIIPDWLEKQLEEEQAQPEGVVKPKIIKEKIEIKTDPAMLEKIARFREEMKNENY